MTETCSSMDVYTLDNREGNRQPNCHITQDMNRLNINTTLFREITGRVSQITLDHFWFSARYIDVKALKDNFYRTSPLPQLWPLLVKNGAVYIGLAAATFIRLVTNEQHFKAYFRISLVHADDVEEIYLVKGSRLISDKLYHTKFGNKDQKPEVAMGTTLRDLRETASEEVGAKLIEDRFKQLVLDNQHHPKGDSSNFYFIKLMKIG
jgi:hypothetical protein